MNLILKVLLELTLVAVFEYLKGARRYISLEA